MVLNMFEGVVGKYCRIVKTDGFIKFGTVDEVNAKFVKIVYADKEEYISFDVITSLSVVNK